MSTPSRARIALLYASGAARDILLVALALVMAFTVWLLFYTDIQAGRAQDDVLAQTAEDWGRIPDRVAEKRYEDIPITDPPGEIGEVWGVLHVPEFSRTSTPIATGTELERVLNTIGMGWYPETQRPGEVGNFALAGHRTTYGKPLNQIDELVEGDPIIVETEDYFYVYRMTSSEIVKPSENQVLAPVPGDTTWTEEPSERVLTLTACHPDYSLAERYVVHAEFDYYTVRADGVPPDLAGTGILEDAGSISEGAGR